MKALYYHITQIFNPSLEDLPKIRSILNEFTNQKQSNQTLSHNLSLLKNTENPLLPFHVFAQNFSFFANDYEILIQNFLSKYQMQFQFSFRNLSKQLSQHHFFSQDEIFEVLIALAEHNELRTTDDIFAQSNQFFAILGTRNCVSEAKFAEFLISSNITEAGIENLSLKLQKLRKTFGNPLQLAIKNIPEITGSVKDFLVNESYIARYNLKFDQLMVEALKKELKRLKLTSEGVIQFVLNLKEVYEKMIQNCGEMEINVIENGDIQSIFNIDRLILDADWEEIDLGLHENQFDLVQSGNASDQNEILFQHNDDICISNLEKQLRLMKKK
ncbi:hypothetical protein SS50377_20345 [Spironucleus salmonicida]|uniref:Uncharacterized protein n=1 Tax=Spironucleus salmonicida TaxID=348837 RepID=V6LH35_9EUKA|nr:hypothetical protein SS50377_20345 [Spironucleus salmonicida]|eukprot:EST43026.1 Hypothetical protein SS50377_17329 [Spironucleus salmonicida]